MPWITALDHQHYARNVPIHLRDLATLEERHPALFVEFVEGKFVGQKTDRKFSKLPLDQMHEQLNDYLKNESGTVGNLDDPRTVRREQVARPEMVRLISEIEDNLQSNTTHHEQYHGFQTKFQVLISANKSSCTVFHKPVFIFYQADVRGLVKSFQDLGNPFLEGSGQLYDVNSSAIMSPDVVANVENIITIGETKYFEFLKERILTQKTPIMDPIKQTRLKLFNAKTGTRKPKAPTNEKESKSMTSRILLASKSGREIPTQLFSHEISHHPPSLTRHGKMYHGTKSELVDLLTHGMKAPINQPPASCVVLDGALMAHILHPRTSLTIGEYCSDVIAPYVQKWLKEHERVDIVFDRYLPSSLKLSTRIERGSGTRLRVTSATKIPSNWQSFLRIDANKKDLFALISKYLQTIELLQVNTTSYPLFTCILYNFQGRTLVTTLDDMCLGNIMPASALSSLSPCQQEEADSRLFLHVASAIAAGHQHVIVRASDSDVVALAVRAAALLNTTGTLWVAYGTGKHFRLATSPPY